MDSNTQSPQDNSQAKIKKKAEISDYFSPGTYIDA
jgi:hypothetical protein